MTANATRVIGDCLSEIRFAFLTAVAKDRMPMPMTPPLCSAVALTPSVVLVGKYIEHEDDLPTVQDVQDAWSVFDAHGQVATVVPMPPTSIAQWFVVDHDVYRRDWVNTKKDIN